MPIIRHVQINHGKISNGQQNDILATSVDYGNYFNNSVVITAQSSQGGYGLLHITRIGKEADSCLNNWLKNLQKNLGKHIIFHIIKPNQDHSEHYQDNLQRACLKHNIDPIIYFFNPTSYFFKTKKQNQTIMINSDGITSKDSEDCEAFENISNPSSTSKSNLATKTYIHPKEAVLTSTSLSQQSQKEFISTIGLILQNAISDLETTIIKNNKNNTLIDEVARETKVVAELKELQTLLPRLTIYPKQPITKEFIEFAQSIINQYYQQTETNCFNLSTKNYYTETHKSQEKIVLNDMLEKLRQAFINAGATANLSTPESLLINGPNGNLGATAFQLSDSWFIIKQKQRLPTETSCQGFINAVNKQIQDTLDKIFHSTASKIVDGEYLAKLQKNLEQLVNEPNQLLTKEFVELINSTINQYDENKEKLTATPEVKHLLSMLKREFSSLLSRDLWPDSEIYGPNVTVDRHGEILVDENYELTTSTIAEPEVYKDAKNQQQLIDAIKLKLSANISQLKKLSTSIFTLPLLSCENNKLKELNALQHDLDELIEDPKQPLTQPFIQQIRRKILLYLFTPSAKKTDINTLEALQQGLNQFVEHPEQPLPAAFIKLIKKQAYLSLLSSFAKKNEREELAILQQGLNQLVEQPGQPLTQTFLKLIKKQIYQSSLTSFTKESERAVLEALQQILEQCIEHPEQSIKVPFIQLLRKKVTLHLFAPPSAPPELSDKEKKNMDIEVINKNKKERIEIKKIRQEAKQLEEIKLELDQFIEFPERRPTPSFIQLVNEKSYQALSRLSGKEDDIPELMMLQQGLEQLIKNPEQSLKPLFLQLIQRKLYLYQKRSNIEEEQEKLELLQQGLDQLINHPKQSLALPFIQLVRKKISLYQQKITGTASAAINNLFTELDADLSNLLLREDLIFNLVPTTSDLNLDLEDSATFLYESNSDWDISPALGNQEEIDSEHQILSPTLFQQHSQHYMEQCEQLMARIYQDQ